MKLILALAALSGCLTPVKDDGDSGYGGAPEIDVTPTSLDFGTVFQLSETTASVNIANLGGAELTGDLALGAGAPFSVGSASFSLAAGESVDVEITVYPEAFGAFSDTITINSNDDDEPVTVVTLSATVSADGDGDGYGPDEDCDDSDPDAYPGAEDVWYDGVDADCEGDDDYDADADGAQSDEHGGDDCDDSDPDAYPGNTEIWYDGVDGDCDGRNDYDADGDSFEGDGGEDCDDQDPNRSPGTLEVPDDGVDNDCDSVVDEDLSNDDVDGDGYSELDGDCNDRNADVNPGAAEVWYDGADGDCDGANDFDADTDGFEVDSFGGDDCDDNDASVNPGASETWYDGVDTNCDGQDDYDADGDGHASDAYGGDDCDDADAAVSPSAAEIWYDGADQDCAGDDDYDADGDGYQSDAYGGDDCDDSAANAYPGGTETWYDGIDGDCAGGSDYDADGDGEDSDAYGGGDCADADPSIRPGYEELCDGIDTDCSGVDDDDYATDADTWYYDDDGDGYGDPGNSTTACDQPSGYVSDDTDCDDTYSSVNPSGVEVAYDALDNDCDGEVDDAIVSDVQAYEISGQAASDALASSLLATPDLNGDGDPELLIGSQLDSTGGSAAGLVGAFDVDALGASVSISAAYSTPYGGAASDYFGHTMAYLGDVDADSQDEIAVSAPYADPFNTNSGAVYVFDLSPNGSHETGSASVTPNAELQGEAAAGQLGTSLSAGDVDGDGIYDLAMGGPNENSGRGVAAVVLSGDGYGNVTGFWSDYASVSFRGSQLTTGLGTAVDITSDVTGNGYTDFVACGGYQNSLAGRCWIIEGSASPSYSNAAIQNYAIANIGGQSAEELGLLPTTLHTGDVNGDGQADVVLGAPVGSSGDGAVYVFLGGSGLTGNLGTGADEDIQITGDGALGRDLLVGEDIDGDGASDLLIGGPSGGSGGQGAVYLLSGPLTASSYTLPDDQAASWIGANAGDGFGTVLSGVLDLEGDGQREFAVSAPGNDDQASNAGMVYVVPTY